MTAGYHSVCKQRLTCLYPSYIMDARHESEHFTIFGEADLYTGKRFRTLRERELVANLLLSNDDSLSRLYDLQSGKPCYVPEKNVLLRYHDECYTEPTSQTRAMKRYLRKELGMNEDRAQEVFENLVFIIRDIDSRMDDVLEYMQEVEKIVFSSEEALKTFLSLYQELHNHTRMQCNCGHTPVEMHTMIPPEERMPRSISLSPNIRRQLLDGTMNFTEMIEGILTMDMPSEELRQDMLRQLLEIKKEQTQQQTAAAAVPEKKQKVGRNDPCPCGSGKKYKKCCGR